MLSLDHENATGYLVTPVYNFYKKHQNLYAVIAAFKKFKQSQDLNFGL